MGDTSPNIDLRQFLSGEKPVTKEKKDAHDLLLDQMVKELAYGNGQEVMRKKAQQMSLDDRVAVAEKAFTFLQKDPQSWEAHLHWQKIAIILQEFDVKRYAQCNAAIVQSTKSALSLLENDAEKDTTDPQLKLADKLKRLYKLISVQSSEEGKKLCTETFLRWEQEMNAKAGKDIPRFVRQQIDYEQKNDAEIIRPRAKDALKKTIDGFATDGKYATMRSKLEQKNEEFFYTSQNKEGKTRTWKVEFYSDAAPLLCFRSVEKAEPGLVFTIDLIDGIEALEADIGKIDRVAERAATDYAQEHGAEQQKVLNGYDLPKDRMIAHVRLFPQSFDEIVSKGLHTSQLLSSTLKSRYGENIVSRPPLFSNEPDQALRKDIEDTLKANGNRPTHFCIDVFSHGTKDHFVFAKKLEAKHLIQIAKDFPQCTFTYNTIACYGGGVMKDITHDEAFAKDENLKSRLTVFTQSKGDVPNLPAHATVATVYYAYLMQALHDGKSYGEAHRIADINVKKHLPLDAEAFIDGMKLSMDKPRNMDNALL
jgi:hypothetical protein